MVEFSRDSKQSTASFIASFSFHIVLIIACSLFLFDYGGFAEVSFHVVTLDDSELVTFESPIDPNEGIDPELFEPELVELETLDQLQETLTNSLPVDDSSFDQNPFKLAPPLSADVMSLDLPTPGKSKFFGVETTGDRIVYIIDMSVSMRYRGYHARRYDRAVAEVLSSVDQLDPEQSFYVYLFCFEKYEMDIGQPAGTFCQPTDQNKRKLRNWLESVDLGAGTDPRESLVLALGRKPTCIFLLSDGEFNGVRYNNGQFGKRKTAVEIARQYNVVGCPIHTIGLEDKANQRKMTAIAKQSGGTYRFVAARE